MNITTTGFDATCDVVIGALPQHRQGIPMAVRERSVAPTYAPMTGGVRLLPVSPDRTGHPTVQGNADGVGRVRTWSPPD